MPSLEDHHSASITKLLLLGDSGTGKTGALASLAKAGYNLRIADMDNGVDIIRNVLIEDGDLAALKRINYQPWQDEFVSSANGASLIPKTAKAWPALVSALSNWPDGLGPVSSWSSQDVLVVDSLNFAGKAALRHIQQLNSRLAAPPSWDDYREAQRLVENLCAKLYSESVRCNVVCLSHVREIGRREDVVDDKNRVRSIEIADSVRGFPETGTGRALSPVVGRYFNAVLLADFEGSGLATRRIIRTIPYGNIGLKNSAPRTVKPSYPIQSGLADYFKAVRSPTKVGA
jgi:AAA domain